MRVMSIPRSVDIDITSRCNLSCAYCYHFSSPGDVRADLSTDQWLVFFKILGDLGIMRVTLAGGEPFIREDLKTLIAGIKENRMRFSILSNGTLMSGSMAQFLSETRRCDGIQISIDGACPETHDAFRGNGSFHKAVNAIHYLQQHRVPVAVRVTIHKKNVFSLTDIAEFLLEEMNLPGFSTNVASYLGQCRQHMDQIRLSIEERVTAMETLSMLAEKYPHRITADAGPLAEARMWRDMVDASEKGLDQTSMGGRLTGCGCVRSKIAVRADGTLVPCTMLPHIELGRINHEGFNKNNFREIWQNHDELRKLRHRHQIPLSDFPACRACEYMAYCTGNCPGLAYTLTGEMNHPSPDACLKRFLESGGRLAAA